jgi:hypothetical protein
MTHGPQTTLRQLAKRAGSANAITASVERGAHAVIRTKVAIADVLGAWWQVRRPFAVEAHLPITLPPPVDKRTADQPAAAGDKKSF